MSKSRKNLIWEAGWYELDQPVKVGETQKFLLWKGENKFYNTLLHDGDYEELKGTIISISHPILGDLNEIDTEGLDYTFILSNGEKIIVNAEEEPGKTFDRKDMSVNDWKFTVIVDPMK